MKTRRILAASTAALLSFASVAVVANAATALTAAKAPNTLEIGSTKTIVGPSLTAEQVNDAMEATDGTAYDKDDINEDELSGDAGDGVTVSVSKKDAQKLKGANKIVTTLTSVEEDDDENVDVGEDTVIAGLGLTDELNKAVAKAKASETVVVDVKVGVDGKVKSTIGKPVTVTVPSTFKGAKVYHVNSDGTVTKLDSTTTKDFDDVYTTEFTTTNFSPFIITTATLKSTANPDAESSDAAASSDATTDANNAETGIALAIAPVVLAAGAVAVVALKKKH